MHDRKRIPFGQPMCLRDGALVDLPGYQLRFHLTNAACAACVDSAEAEVLEQIPAYFYMPPPPAASVR